MRVGGRSMLRVIGRLTSYLEPTGLAAARTDVRALRVVIIPAFAIETVCCSLGQQLAVVRVAAVPKPKDASYHNFMQYTTRGFRHLIKLVNTTNTSVAQDECATVMG